MVEASQMEGQEGRATVLEEVVGRRALVEEALGLPAPCTWSGSHSYATLPALLLYCRTTRVPPLFEST